MKTNYFSILGICALIAFGCNKQDEILEVKESQVHDIELSEEGEVLQLGDPETYYLDGVEVDLGDIIESPDQIWANYLDENNVLVCNVFSTESSFLEWWQNNGATSDDLTRYTKCMEIRDYAEEHDIETNYGDEEDFDNFPVHFQDYVLDKLPDYNGASYKNDQTHSTLNSSIWKKQFDNTNFSGSNKTWAAYAGNYGSFDNKPSSMQMAHGTNFFCDKDWFRGRKWFYFSIVLVQFNSLGTANNRWQSHF